MSINNLFSLFSVDANVCKNDRCTNLGKTNAAEYVWPTYYLGFPALHCDKCGSNALLLNNDDINAILRPKFDLYTTQIEKRCPKCYKNNCIKYGTTVQKTPRFQCKSCQTVFSPKQLTNKQKLQLVKLGELLLSRVDFKTIIQKMAISYSQFYHLLSTLASICHQNNLSAFTKIHFLPEMHINTASQRFESRTNASNSLYLWGITSAISESGYILLNNINYTEIPISVETKYDGLDPVNLEKNTKLSINAVAQQYEIFIRRKSFDQLRYHPKKFESNKFNIVEPVISAYTHFYELKRYFAAKHYYHYLEHEILLRSAAVTTFAKEIQQNKCAIFYFYETKAINNQTVHIDKHKIGWWDNDWYLFKNRDQQIHKMLGVLTSQNTAINQDVISKLPATFSGIEDFYNQFYYYFPIDRLKKLNPDKIATLLTIFTGFYNYCLSSHNNSKTTAQMAGLINNRLSIKEFTLLHR